MVLAFQTLGFGIPGFTAWGGSGSGCLGFAVWFFRPRGLGLFGIQSSGSLWGLTCSVLVFGGSKGLLFEVWLFALSWLLRNE